MVLMLPDEAALASLLTQLFLGLCFVYILMSYPVGDP